MITFILIIAISMGLAFGVNALFLEKKPRGGFVTVLITVAIAIVSAVFGLVVSAVLIEKMGYQIAVEKAIGPSIGVAAFATWRTLKRRKRSDPWVEESETIKVPAAVGPKIETIAPAANQVTQEVPETISKRTRISVGFAGVSTLLASTYPPWVSHLDPSDEHYEFYLKMFGDSPRVRWAFLWESESGLLRRVSIAWDHFSLELLVIGVVSILLFVFMKDGKWPLK